MILREAVDVAVAQCHAAFEELKAYLLERHSRMN